MLGSDFMRAYGLYGVPDLVLPETPVQEYDRFPLLCHGFPLYSPFNLGGFCAWARTASKDELRDIIDKISVTDHRSQDSIMGLRVERQQMRFGGFLCALFSARLLIVTGARER